MTSREDDWLNEPVDTEAFEQPMTRKTWTEEYYLSVSNIVLAVETETIYGADQPTNWIKYWTASIDASSYKKVGAFKTSGPTVQMSMTGETADDAYQNLVKALEAQGWTVK